MGRSNAMHKPGETAPEAGTYVCYICSLKGEESTCEKKQGEMFAECPKCLEGKVAEWDMTWMPAGMHLVKAGTKSSLPWPGSLGKKA